MPTDVLKTRNKPIKTMKILNSNVVVELVGDVDSNRKSESIMT